MVLNLMDYCIGLWNYGDPAALGDKVKEKLGRFRPGLTCLSVIYSLLAMGKGFKILVYFFPYFCVFHPEFSVISVIYEFCRKIDFS